MFLTSKSTDIKIAAIVFGWTITVPQVSALFQYCYSACGVVAVVVTVAVLHSPFSFSLSFRTPEPAQNQTAMTPISCTCDLCVCVFLLHNTRKANNKKQQPQRFVFGMLFFVSRLSYIHMFSSFEFKCCIIYVQMTLPHVYHFCEPLFFGSMHVKQLKCDEIITTDNWFCVSLRNLNELRLLLESYKRHRLVRFQPKKPEKRQVNVRSFLVQCDHLMEYRRLFDNMF